MASWYLPGGGLPWFITREAARRSALSGLWAVEKADDGNPWDTSYLPDE